ncbi:Protein phosphatase 2C-like protein 1 [Elsinoe fawcettii]|nr:Protein phosphatase 2C-like protein 1 [Elsinoe fawcettii]
MSQRLLSRTWRPLARNTSTLRTCPPKTHYHKQSSRVSRSLAKPLGIGCVVLGAGFTTFTAYQRNGTSGLFRNASAQSLDDMEDFSADADGGPFQQLGGPLIVDENTDLIALHSQMHKDDDCVTHACALASNSPREDFMTAGSFEARKTGVTDWRYWEIFDGHAGSQTARALESLLHVVVVGEISDPEHKDSSVADSIKRAFVRLDEVFLSSAKDALAITPATSRETAAVDVALAGSCALASFYDVAKSTLYVANTGDSRAVLGRYSSLSGSYAPQPLSFDHTGFNESEVKRIEAQHPGETGIIDPKTGRIFGLAVVRAFGDTRWKWDDDTVMEAHKKFWGPKPRPNGVIKTPPYLTAEPEVTETEVVKGRNGDFVIMASDGLWDHLSSEQAVTIVEQWREMKKKGMLGKENYSIPEDEDTYYDERPGYGLTWRQKPEYFCYQDENVAACLVRNAMGGKRKHLVDRVTKMEPPLSRDAHDDVSVQVIFLHEHFPIEFGN